MTCHLTRGERVALVIMVLAAVICIYSLIQLWRML